MSDRVRPEPAKYKTTNWRRYNQALKSRGALMIWLDRDLQWSGIATGKRGRTPTFSDAAIQFCLTIKGLFGLALRQAMGMVESLLKLAGLPWQVPDYSTVCRRQKTLKVRIPYRPAAQGLHLLVDSTGLKMMGEGEWKRKKHGAEYRRQWRKLHLGIDAQTMEIRAVEVTPNSVGDAPMLPALLGQITPKRRCCRSAAMGPMTPRPVTRRSRDARPKPSSRSERTPASPGRRTVQEPARATRSCVRHSDWAARSGSAGAGTTAAAWSRPRCAASS